MSDKPTKKSLLEVSETDLPEIIVTQKTIDAVVAWASGRRRASLRCTRGKPYAYESLEEQIKRIYGTPLPHFQKETPVEKNKYSSFLISLREYFFGF